MAKWSKGTTLKIGANTVGSLTSISGVELSADTIDVSTLDSVDGYREYVAGFVDGGEVSAEGFLSNAGTSESTIIGLVGGAEQECEITFPNGAEWAFDGIVTGFSTSAGNDDPVSFSITIKVTGKPTFTAGTESQG